MPKQASAIELKNYFELSTPDFMTEWKLLTIEEKTYLKVELGKVLYPDSKEE